MIYDDKTTEIVISTPTTLKQESSKAEKATIEPQPLSRASHISSSPQVAVAKSHWLHNLQEELSEDWTLRVIAALTILVLSLLVL